MKRDAIKLCPLQAKAIGYRTQDGTLDCRNEVSSSPNQNCPKGRVKGIAEIWSERRDSIDNLNIDKKLLFRGSPLPNAARVYLFSQRALKSPSSIRTRTRLGERMTS